jgi:hypothetical protein
MPFSGNQSFENISAHIIAKLLTMIPLKAAVSSA